MRDLNDAAILDYIREGIRTAPDMVCTYYHIERVLYGKQWRMCSYSNRELYDRMMHRTLRRCRSLEKYGIIRGVRMKGTPTIWLLIDETN